MWVREGQNFLCDIWMEMGQGVAGQGAPVPAPPLT